MKKVVMVKIWSTTTTTKSNQIYLKSYAVSRIILMRVSWNSSSFSASAGTEMWQTACRHMWHAGLVGVLKKVLTHLEHISCLHPKEMSGY